MERIILFDGICNLCNHSVQFIIKRDPKAKFQFASLQSDIGQKLRKEYNIQDKTDSVVLIEGKNYYVESTAALRIAKQLKGMYPLLYCFIIIPKPIRDLFYRYIAKNRYKWFGKKDSCMLPTKGMKERFKE
ncbi:thiol-disulfide oxidoreductase DCC family protein [Gracilibacillus marinus]|uniref:Thiol-disulfide oxidoreductase DCC family protein n=1 Tax=Gracilibacillus marinus TaxID=630535 RepID=A0ABV8VV01_9BACI